jgi:DNA gyrase subunit A
MEIGTIKQVDIQQEMQGAYLDYAMSVIVARALPDVRDGLKPVHRRILYAMHDMGLTHDKPYKKSARIVGEVLGKYHPHGDSAVYDAMVRMAQDFSLRYTLVDGQGNFGSIDGDNPAAMRYTEARLQALSQEMLADIDKSTVDFGPNFDETLSEPTVLPAALPNLLVNGASGIAVGMATNIPPHNLGEVCDALIYLLGRYDQIDDVTVEELMRFVKGPDFPTAGILYRYGAEDGGEREDVIGRAYASGRGHFRVQARAHIEEMSRNRNRIVVSELPYQVNKTNLIERIAELARDGRIEGISDLRDESDRSGMRIVIELTRTADPRAVLADLYKLTPMQQTFGMSMLALVDGEPRMLSLRRVLQHYIEHRREIIRRRSEYELARARERAHILQGLLKALDVLDEVIQTIRRSETTETARANLVRHFKFTEIQAQAILDMPLKRLAALERKRLREEYDGLVQRIAYLEDLLAHPHKILGVIQQEIVSLKERYGDARRTRIVEAGVSRESLTVRDFIEDEPVLIALGRSGLLLRESAADRRRGKLPNKVDGDPPLAIAAGTAHDEILLFAADGRLARLPVHRLADGAETHPVELGAFGRNDRLVAMLAIGPASEEEGDQRFLVLATREGRVKRVALSDAQDVISVSTAMNVDDGDELIGVGLSDESAEILLVTKLGQAIRFRANEVRPMGLPAAGVWGMKLSSGDEVVSLCITRTGGQLVVATTTGYFKRTPLDDFPVQGRHGGGVSAIRLGQNTGAIVDARLALPGDELFSASRRGTLRKLDLQEIPAGKRSAQGKLLVQPAQGDRIATLLHLPTVRSRPARASGGDAQPPVASRRSVAPTPDYAAEAAQEELAGGQMELLSYDQPPHAAASEAPASPQRATVRPAARAVVPPPRQPAPKPASARSASQAATNAPQLAKPQPRPRSTTETPPAAKPRGKAAAAQAAPSEKKTPVARGRSKPATPAPAAAPASPEAKGSVAGKASAPRPSAAKPAASKAKQPAASKAAPPPAASQPAARKPVRQPKSAADQAVDKPQSSQAKQPSLLDVMKNVRKSGQQP